VRADSQFLGVGDVLCHTKRRRWIETTGIAAEERFLFLLEAFCLGLHGLS